jgi:hypothetical protein
MTCFTTSADHIFARVAKIVPKVAFFSKSNVYFSLLHFSTLTPVIGTWRNIGENRVSPL